MHRLDQRLANYNLQAQSSPAPIFEWPVAKNDFTFLNGYILNGYISAYIMYLILPFVLQILKYLPSDALSKGLPAPDQIYLLYQE